MKKDKAIFKPVEAFKSLGWYKISSSLRKSVYGLVLALCGLVSMQSCGTIKEIPVETNTQVNIKDSTVFHYIDSVRIHEATRYKDMAWLGDTLQIEGQRSRMWAYADTTKEALLGGLQEDKVEEKTRIIYKDKIEYRDSLVFKEVPVEVEKEVRYIPKWTYWSLIANMLVLILIGLRIWIKSSGLNISSIFKKG